MVKVVDNIVVRRMADADREHVMAATATHDEPIDRAQFAELMSECVGLAAEWYGEFAGYCFYHEEPTHFEVIDLSVADTEVAREVIAKLLSRVKLRLSVRQPSIVVALACDEVAGHAAYRSQGFLCRHHHHELDCFVFRYQHPGYTD